MNDRSACKVERGELPNHVTNPSVKQPALAPNHVRHRAVNHQQPQQRIQEHAAEFHALGIRAADQRRRNDCEHALIDHPGGVRDGLRVLARRATDLAQKGEAKAAEEWCPRVKRQAVADDGPHDAHHRHQDEALHHRGQNVLAAHQAAIKERESGSGHHEHERGAGEHPRRVAAAHLPGFVNLDAAIRRRRRRSGGAHFSREKFWGDRKHQARSNRPDK